MIKGGSVVAQASAAKGLANIASFDKVAGQDAIAAAGAIPLLLNLLSVGKAQMPAAHALAQLARKNPAIQTEISAAGGIAPLLSLLNGVNTDAQVKAAAAIAEMSWHNKEVQDSVAKAGGISPLLSLVASRSPAAQARGMGALAQLAHDNRENQDFIARLGGVKIIIPHLGLSSSPDVQTQAAFALAEVSRSNHSIQTSIVDHGGISQLAGLIKNSQHAEVKTHVAGALWSMSEDPKIKISIAGASAIQPLVELLGLGEGLAVMHAAKALASIGFENQDNLIQITRLLIELLSLGTKDGQTRAVQVLQTIRAENPSSHQTIADAGEPEPVVDLLKAGIPEAKDYALWSLSLSICGPVQGVVASAGGVTPLIKQLDDYRVRNREEAAAALAKLAHNNDDTRSQITKEGGIKPLIRQLVPGPSSSELVRQNAAAALADLAVDTAARDEIVGMGGIRPLVLLLEDDGHHTKKFVSMALARLAKEHEATQTAIAEAGAIAPLVALLDGKEGLEAQEEAAGALFALADHERNRLGITEADGIGWLVMLLGCPNPRSREHAEGALVRLSIETSNRVQIIKKLVDMLQDSGNAAQEQAAAALANLARESEDNRKTIVDANGIVPLLALLDADRHSSPKAKENAVGALKQLCRRSKENQSQIARAGGIPKLVNVLLGFSGATMKDSAIIQLCTLAAEAVKEMAKGNKKNQDAIAAEGAIAPLVAMLGSPSAQMQANAAGALANLARGNQPNQSAIAKTGAVAPLCALVREGSAETKDQSASALWALSTDNAPNKDTIAKLGGIDPLVGLLITSDSEKSQMCIAGGLAALAFKHPDNRQLIAKRLVGLLGSSQAKAAEKATRVLTTCSSFFNDHHSNQVAVAKIGGIPPLIQCLQAASGKVQAYAAHAMFCLAQNNTTTQQLIAKSDAIPPLVALMKRSTPAAQEHATRAIWHLASQEENHPLIVEAGCFKPMVSMLAAEGDVLPELSAFVMVRLAQSNAAVAMDIAETGGIKPLVKLLSHASPGAQKQAASALAEIALVSKTRDVIASAGGIEPLVHLMDSSTVGTPETAARAIAHISREDVDMEDEWIDPEDNSERARNIRKRRKALVEDIRPEDMINGCAARRAVIHTVGGLQRLIALLDGSNLFDNSIKTTEVKKKKTWIMPPHVIDEKDKGGGPPPPESTLRSAMQEHASAALADIAHDNFNMQDLIIGDGGIPPLLAFIRSGTPLGQEHGARAIWHLAEQNSNQMALINCGAIPDLVMLVKSGSPKAQEYAAAGLMDLGRGAIAEWVEQQKKLAAAGKRNALKAKHFHAEAAEYADILAKVAAEAAAAEAANPPSEKEKKEKQKKEDEDDFGSPYLEQLAEAGGIQPLIALLSSGTAQARENATGALWHLALDTGNQMQIAKFNGVPSLVTVLDDGTPKAHSLAADALARLAIDSAENQAQIAKYLVSLLGNQSAGAQRRAAHAVCDLAANHPGSPGIIVNAGAISPLVNLLSNGVLEVKKEAAKALSTLSLASPANQLAIASGLVALLGAGSIEAQEHVTQLLLTLSYDDVNRFAISKAGAISRLVIQLRGGAQTSMKTQEISAAVLARLSGDSDENVAAISAASGIRPLVALLTSDSTSGQAHAATVLADMGRHSKRNRNVILNESAVAPLIALLTQGTQDAKAEAAGALHSLSAGNPETQKLIAEAGAIKPLVALLGEDHNLARKKAAGAIAALSLDMLQNQDAVEKFMGIGKLVGLLGASISDEVRAEAAAALAVLALDNRKNQDKLAADGGIAPLVGLLKEDTSEYAKEQASSALMSLAKKHYENQVAVAQAGGIAPLVACLGLASTRAQEQSAGALAALALDNKVNESSIATLIVELLGSTDKQTSAKAARGISRLARAHPSNQDAIAVAGGIQLLVSLLDIREGGVPMESKPPESKPMEESKPLEPPRLRLRTGTREIPILPSEPVEDKSLALEAKALESAKVQKEMASAIWSMAVNNLPNQIVIAETGGIPLLIALLKGHPEVHRDVAGALSSLASHSTNQIAIAHAGGIVPLVGLLSTASREAQETVAAALHSLAETSANRMAIASAGGITPLVDLFDGGTDDAKAQAAGALQTLVVDNVPNQVAVSQDLVRLIKTGSALAQEHVTELLRNLATNPDNRGAIAKAGAIPELVRQLESGSEKSMEMAAAGLVLISLKSQAEKATVTQELVKLLASEAESVRQRASEALRGVADEDKSATKAQAVGTGGGGPLVNLLKDGLKDGRVEAQEYALWSLSSITNQAAKEAVVQAGGIKPLIAALVGGKISPTAQEHAAAVLSGLAPIGTNAEAIRKMKGIEPLVRLLLEGTPDAKVHAADALAQLALRAGAALDISRAGAIPAFVGWLADPTLGPPEVAARALSDIALDSTDTQSQIAEEGAIAPLISMVAAGTKLLTGSGRPSSAAVTAMKHANMAALALATLAKDNIVIQVTITEEDGIVPLVELLKRKAHITYQYATKALWRVAACEENQTAIALAGGLPPLVELLSDANEITQQYAAAAIESLARDHLDNQVALMKGGAIIPLVALLGTDSVATQEHAVGALLNIASNDVESRDRVIFHLVEVLDTRNASAQMKSAVALAVLASRNADNRTAITAHGAIQPLIRLMGDGKSARTDTPQERAAAVLCDLARGAENKETIVAEKGVPPLVAMLSCPSPEAQTHAAGALWHLALLEKNRTIIAGAGGIEPLVALLGSPMENAQMYSAGALFHLASNGDNRVATVKAGAIPSLVALIHSKLPDTREHAASVLSALAVSRGNNKKMIVQAGGIPALIALLSDTRVLTQRHAACSLWGLTDGPDGIYDKQIIEYIGLPPLLHALQRGNDQTCGFAAACLTNLCRDPDAKRTMIELGASDALLELARSPATWLRGQAIKMINLLGISIANLDHEPPPPWASQLFQKSGGNDGSPDRGKGKKTAAAHYEKERIPMSITAKQKYHFFSFQTNTYNGFRDEYWPPNI